MIRRIAPLPAAGLLALTCLNAWLLMLVVEESVRTDDVAVGKFDWTPTFTVSAKGIPDTKPIAAYQQILAHPVFFKSREPFVAPPPRPPPAPAPVAMPVVADPGVSLGGILIAHDTRKAYLLRKTAPAGTWVSQGEDVQGWKVQSVEPGSVKLRNGDRAIELQLYPRR